MFFRAIRGALTLSGYAICALGLSWILGCAEAEVDRQLVSPQDQHAAKSKEIERTLNKNFSFYGKIIDQDNQPVIGASCFLDASTLKANPGVSVGITGKFEVKSDASGSFSFADAGGFLFIISATAPGYLIDTLGLDFNYLKASTIRSDRLSSKEDPYVIHAWKLGPPLANREIDVDLNWEDERLKVADGKEVFVAIRLDMGGSGESRFLRNNPMLTRVGSGDDWDLALSLVGNSANAGETPLVGPNGKRLPQGAAVRVRAKSGGVRQTEVRFPFIPGEITEFLSKSDLQWAGSKSLGSDVYFRILYHNDIHGYQSFLTIKCSGVAKSEDADCRLGFDRLAPFIVSQAGVINISGVGLLEYFPEYVRGLKNPEVIKEERDDLMRKQRYQEEHLLEIRKSDPALARQIEERMRSEGKVVPP
jgi:hypothetical protein